MYVLPVGAWGKFQVAVKHLRTGIICLKAFKKKKNMSVVRQASARLASCSLVLGQG